MGPEGWFQDDSTTLHLLCTWLLRSLHQLHLRSLGIRSQKWRTPDWATFTWQTDLFSFILVIFVSILKFAKSHTKPWFPVFLRNQKFSQYWLKFPHDNGMVGCSKGQYMTVISVPYDTKVDLILPWHWWFSSSQEPFLVYMLLSRVENEQKKGKSIYLKKYTREIAEALCIYRCMCKKRIVLICLISRIHNC